MVDHSGSKPLREDLRATLTKLSEEQRGRLKERVGIDERSDITTDGLVKMLEADSDRLTRKTKEIAETLQGDSGGNED